MRKHALVAAVVLVCGIASWLAYSRLCPANLIDLSSIASDDGSYRLDCLVTKSGQVVFFNDCLRYNLGRLAAGSLKGFDIKAVVYDPRTGVRYTQNLFCLDTGGKFTIGGYEPRAGELERLRLTTEWQSALALAQMETVKLASGKKCPVRGATLAHLSGPLYLLVGGMPDFPPDELLINTELERAYNGNIAKTARVFDISKNALVGTYQLKSAKLCPSVAVLDPDKVLIFGTAPVQSKASLCEVLDLKMARSEDFVCQCRCSRDMIYCVKSNHEVILFGDIQAPDIKIVDTDSKTCTVVGRLKHVQSGVSQVAITDLTENVATLSSDTYVVCGGTAGSKNPRAITAAEIVTVK